MTGLTPVGTEMLQSTTAGTPLWGLWEAPQFDSAGLLVYDTDTVQPLGRCVTVVNKDVITRNAGVTTLRPSKAAFGLRPVEKVAVSFQDADTRDRAERWPLLLRSFKVSDWQRLVFISAGFICLNVANERDIRSVGLPWWEFEELRKLRDGLEASGNTFMQVAPVSFAATCRWVAQKFYSGELT